MDLLSLSLLVITLPLYSSVEDQWFSHPTKGCVWNFTKDMREDVSLEDCKEICLTETRFPCKSIEYNEVENRKCYWLEETKGSQPNDWQAPCSTTEYQHMVYLERIEGAQKWFSDPIQGCVWDNTKDVMEDVSLEDCKAFCLAQTNCKSIEYNKKENRKCYWLEETKESQPKYWKAPCSTPEYEHMVYLERIVPLFTAPVKGCVYGCFECINMEDVSLPDCLRFCLDESRFVCNSVEYIFKNDGGKKFCSIAKETKESHPGPYEEPCKDHWAEMVYFGRIGVPTIEQVKPDYEEIGNTEKIPTKL